MRVSSFLSSFVHICGHGAFHLALLVLLWSLFDVPENAIGMKDEEPIEYRVYLYKVVHRSRMIHLIVGASRMVCFILFLGRQKTNERRSKFRTLFVDIIQVAVTIYFMVDLFAIQNISIKSLYALYDQSRQQGDEVLVKIVYLSFFETVFFFANFFAIPAFLLSKFICNRFGGFKFNLSHATSEELEDTLAKNYHNLR